MRYECGELGRLALMVEEMDEGTANGQPHCWAPSISLEYSLEGDGTVAAVKKGVRVPKSRPYEELHQLNG